MARPTEVGAGTRRPDPNVLPDPRETVASRHRGRDCLGRSRSLLSDPNQFVPVTTVPVRRRDSRVPLAYPTLCLFRRRPRYDSRGYRAVCRMRRASPHARHYRDDSRRDGRQSILRDRRFLPRLEQAVRVSDSDDCQWNSASLPDREPDSLRPRDYLDLLHDLRLIASASWGSVLMLRREHPLVVRRGGHPDRRDPGGVLRLRRSQVRGATPPSAERGLGPGGLRRNVRGERTRVRHEHPADRAGQRLVPQGVHVRLARVVRTPPRDDRERRSGAGIRHRDPRSRDRRFEDDHRTAGPRIWTRRSDEDLRQTARRVRPGAAHDGPVHVRRDVQGARGLGHERDRPVLGLDRDGQRGGHDRDGHEQPESRPARPALRRVGRTGRLDRRRRERRPRGHLGPSSPDARDGRSGRPEERRGNSRLCRDGGGSGRGDVHAELQRAHEGPDPRVSGHDAVHHADDLRPPMASLDELLTALFGTLGPAGSLVILLVIFAIDAALFPALPEVWIVVTYTYRPEPIGTIAWAGLLLAMAVAGDILGTSLLYAAVRRWVVQRGRMPHWLERSMKKWTSFLLVRDERVILMNRAVPVIPMVGVFIAK